MTKLMFVPVAISLLCNSALSQAEEPAVPESVPVAPPPAPPPPATATNPASPPAPDGQWVYTNQYGWLWMPYGQPYTYVRPDSDVAYVYAYYPAYGWRWVDSPWVFGLGPAPYWGVRGRVGFAWYAHPWFHSAYAFHGYRGGVAHAPRFAGRAAGGFHGGFHGGGHGHR